MSILKRSRLLLLLFAIRGFLASDSITFSKSPVLCPPVNSAEHIHSSYHNCPAEAFQLLLLPRSWTNLFGKLINETEYHEIATMVQGYHSSPWYKRNDVHWRTVNYTIHVEGMVVRYMEIQDVSNFTNGILLKSTTVPLDLPNEEAYVQENVFCIVKYRNKFVMDVFSNFSLINPGYASEWFANSMLNVYSRYVNTFSIVLDNHCKNPERIWLPRLEFSYGEGPSLYTESEERESQHRKMLTTKSASYEDVSVEGSPEKAPDRKQKTTRQEQSPQRLSDFRPEVSCDLSSYTAQLISIAVVVVLFLAVMMICCTVLVWIWSRRRQIDIADLQTVVASRRSSHLLLDKDNVLLTI